MHQYILSAAYFLNRIITREIIFYRRQSSWLSICFHDAVLSLVISFSPRNILYISMLAPWIPRYKIITSILNFFFSKQSSLPPPSPKRKKTSYNLRKDINYFACFYTNNIQSVTSSRILSNPRGNEPIRQLLDSHTIKGSTTKSRHLVGRFSRRDEPSSTKHSH